MPPKKRPARAAPSDTKPADADEVAFPRGGADILTPLEKKQLTAKARAASAEELASSAPRKKQKKSSAASDKQDEEESLFFNKAVQQGNKTYVELLKFKSLVPGMKLLGIVVEVSKKGLVVSLPHGLRANITPQEASDVISLMLEGSSKEGALLRATLSGKVPPLADLFTVGQYVRCVILDTTSGDTNTGTMADAAGQGKEGKKKKKAAAANKAASKKHVHASLRLSRLLPNVSTLELSDGLLLPAYVRTCEDHGYTLGFGFKGVRGFLRQSDYESVFGEGQRLAVGTLLDVVVKDCADKRNVAVSINPLEVGTRVVTSADSITLPSLLPGTLVPAKVGKVLADGLLVSFLTYFQGSIDKFHLPQPLPPKELTASFAQGDKLKARVLYVDTSENKVGLTLVPHVVSRQPPQPPVLLGEVLSGCVVHRVDADLGLLLQLPSKDPAGQVAAGFVHVSNLSEEHVENPSKVFKVGQKVTARVIGFRLLEGLAVMSMKQSVISRQVASYKDIHPSLHLEGTVATLADFGLLVNISSGIRAVVPTMHLSDIGSLAKKAKFKEGQKVSGRVLDVDPAAKRVTMTLKKGLVDSKLPPFTCLEELQAGMKSHGWVTRVQDFGVFIAFYNGLKGMAHVSDLGLTPGQKPVEVFQEGQVVRAHVLAVDLAQQRLKLSLVSSKARQADDAVNEVAAAAIASLLPGTIVSGTVTRIEETGDKVVYTLKVVHEGSTVEGRLESMHLADHPAAVDELKTVVKVGTELPRLLVLECKETAPQVQLTRKASMLEAAHNLPSSFDQVKETAILPGFVASVTADAVYVRYLNRVTGRAGLAQLADTFVSVPSNHYRPGQSVISVVITVDATRQRFNVSLKPSVVSAPNAAYLHGLFRDLEFAEELRAKEDAEEEGSAQVDWADTFAVGAVVNGQAHEVKEFGVMCDLELHADLVGHALPSHVAGEVKVGASLQGRVLDVSKGEGIVELTLLPRWMPPQAPPNKKKKTKEAAAGTAQLQVGTECKAEVLLSKEHYAVVALPEHGNALAFISKTDFNKQQPGSTSDEALTVGKQLSVLVAALPSASTGGRLLLVPASAAGRDSRKRKSDADGSARKKQKAEEKVALKKGSVVEGTVESVNPVGLCVMCKGHVGRVHAGEVDDWNPDSFKAGQVVKAVVLGKAAKAPSGKRKYAVDLSLREASLSAAVAGEAVAPVVSSTPPTPGSKINAFVLSVATDHMVVSVNTGRTARIALWDAVQTVQEARTFQQLFKPGQSLTCRVLKVGDKGLMDLSLRDVDSGTSAGSCTALQPGMTAVGQIKAAGGQGVQISLGRKLSGRVALTDIQDVWRANALEGLKAGSYVLCRVLEELKADQVSGWVSLRPSQGGVVEGLEPAVLGEEVHELSAEDIKVAQSLPAYIKSVVEGKGAFVILSRGVDARIKLKDLADRFVKEPKKEFPPGKLVRGRVVSVAADGRIDMSLKSADATSGRQWLTFGQLKEGDVVTGKVRNVRDFGVFVEIGHSSLVGLAHISECSDDFISDISELFSVGQSVQAVVTKLDAQTQKVSLSLKKSSVELAQQAAAAMAGEGEDGDAQGAEDMEAELVAALEEEEEGSEDEDDELHENGKADEDESGEDDSDDGADDDEDELAARAKLRAAVGALDDDDDEDDEEEGDSEDDAEMDLQGGAKRARTAGPSSEDDEDGTSDIEQEDEGGENGEGEKSAGALYSMLRSGPITNGWEELELGEGDKDLGAAKPDKDGEAKKTTSARKLKRLHQEKEQQIHATEMARLQGKHELKSVDDFEQLVRSSPNSSFAWIKYMAFLISVGEMDKTRALAERAIQTINYRQEDEKFIVWVAWLNMENLYGQPDPDEAAMKLFNRALAFTDQKKLYLAFCGILQRTNKEQLLEQVIKAMTKKFSSSSKVWLLHIERLIRTGSREVLPGVLDRAVKCLPQRKHVKLMSKAALLEFKLGDAERGRSMLEGILINYPKRLDLWSLYLDQEIKHGDLQRVRALFERATHLQLPAKKMKAMFKKYLGFEKQHGDASTVEHVKKRAMEFVEQSMGA